MMKTLKFALIAALIACTTVSLSYADGFKSKPNVKKVVNLNLQKAIQIPGLLTAMYAQIDKDDFLNSTQHYFVADVVYQGNIYRISGSRAQWIRYFGMKGDLPVNTKNKGISID